jgi:hypothetical protein
MSRAELQDRSLALPLFHLLKKPAYKIHAIVEQTGAGF